MEGKEVDGVVQADGEAGVVRTLDERGLFPVQITERSAARPAMSRGIKPRHIGVMYGQLADLLSAGVPMLRAMEILSRVGLNRRLVERIERVREDLAAGRTLADAMDRHPGVFTPLHTAMIRAGERAGFLEEVLTNLASFIDRQDDLRSKVRGALVYPAVLTGVGLTVITAVLVLLVPKFKPFFVNIELPLPTTVLFALSDLLVHNLLLLVCGAVLIAIAARAVLRSEGGGKLWDRWRMRMPVAGRVLKMVAITRFCRILGTMLTNGVPILQALTISKDATGSTTMAESIEQAAENVRAGDPLAEPLRKGGLFPAEIVEMIAVGEESNQLDKVLVQVADTVERRTNRQVDLAVRLIEPVILVLLAAAIAVVAVGLLYPIFVMGQTLG